MVCACVYVCVFVCACVCACVCVCVHLTDVSHVSYSVAYVSRSGGMSNELNNIIIRNTNGVYEGVAIGGDRYIGLLPTVLLIP